MKYRKIVEGRFIDRPNRFIAHVCIDGKVESVHVKNTGRCKEILLPDTKVLLEESDNLSRKTKYDLVTAYKETVGWINIDSQAPNQIAREYLEQQDYTYIKPEYKYGNSRIDFYMERGDEKYLMEVKGCTQEFDGQGYFPDAPSERAVKHVYELIKAKKEGYHAMIAFVIQMEGIESVLPNRDIHPEFGQALDEAISSGVEILYVKCQVGREEVRAL